MTLRPELTPLPGYMKDLPIHRGYPVPWFVEWLNGEPEFRLADGRKRKRAVEETLCWCCGKSMFAHRFPMTKVFVIGPMCGVNRISSEPPCHRECAEWSAINCPFLSRPQAKRRDASDIPIAEEPAGVMLERNPAVTMLWPTLRYEVVRVPNGQLFRIGEPTDRLSFYREGRAATRAEILDSIDSGIPLLIENERPENRARAEAEIAAARTRLLRLLPAEVAS